MNIKRYKLIFWDFDGVIKDSALIKIDAFVKLFESYGPEIKNKILHHNLTEGGMTRFEKFPLYCRWANIEPTNDKILELSEKFKELVLQAVINSNWIPGVEKLLRNNPYNQKFILASGTPQDEMIEIIHALGLFDCFLDIFGSPNSKSSAIKISLSKYNIDPIDTLFVGDSKSDMNAADVFKIPFLLRVHSSNKAIFLNFQGNIVEDFVKC